MKSEKEVKFGKRKALRFAVLFALLAFVSIGCAFAETIYVNYGELFKVVNAANLGDTAENVNFSLEILEPTTGNPANAGPFNDPQQIFIIVEVIDVKNITDLLRLINALHSSTTVLVGEKKADIISVNLTLIWEPSPPLSSPSPATHPSTPIGLNFRSRKCWGIRGNMTINPPKQESTGYYDLTVIVNLSGTDISDNEVDAVHYEQARFDTGPGTYPSIMGTHKGEIKPSCNINVSKLYTYACAGTGGHTESIKLYENGELIANGTWNGYIGDYHNITIHNLTGEAPYVTLLKNYEYRYVIKTGSYPQIIHEPSKNVTGGTITCNQFIDANGKIYTDWIPAIKFF